MKRVAISQLIELNFAHYDVMEINLIESLMDVNAITANRLNNRFEHVMARHPELAQDLIDVTKFAPTTLALKERLMLVVEGHAEMPRCRCGKRTSFDRASGRWNRYCSRLCANRDPALNRRAGTRP